MSTQPDRRILVDLKDRHLPNSIGSKALQLRRLMDNGVRIPNTLVCTWEAYQRYRDDDVEIVAELRSALAQKLRPGCSYAVRSSANIEDGRERSFAGQFKTVLDVRGIDPVFEAIWAVWATADSPAVQTYLQRQENEETILRMAVIIQEMIEPQAAGVVLSRNPVTGADEIVIEAVLGRGDQLVQSGMTPHRWVARGKRWIEKPENIAISPQMAEKIVAQTHDIARKFKANVDLEWAWDGKELYWLQMREITALNRQKIYSNQMAREMLPGMIKPLVWSVNIPLKSAVFVQFLNEMLGDTGAQASQLIRAFYYRVYFNMSAIGEVFEKVGLPGDSVEMMIGLRPMGSKVKMRPTARMALRLPRMVGFIHDKWQFHRKMTALLPQLQSRVQAVRWQEAGQLSPTELLAAIDRLVPLVQELTYYNILCPILSVMHHRALENQLKHAGISLGLLDISEGLTELDEYDPQVQLHRLHKAFSTLDASLQEQIRANSYEQFLNMAGIASFQQEMANFIAGFGYLSDNGNDFSCQTWREDPGFVLRLVLDFNPAPQEKPAKVRLDEVKTPAFRRPMLKFFYQRVRHYRLLREQLSRLYTYTYGLFRCYYLECGRRLAQQGKLDDRDDVFYLSDEEVRRLLAEPNPLPEARAAVAYHKAEIEKFRDATLPGLVYGDEAPLINVHHAAKMTGIATSAGRFTGPARVTRGIADFSKVEQGDVLIIPYSDVGWSPLFARVGAVIAESGGLLSHSSIIAREYGIPAVVSVNGAMSLRDNVRVTVDGYSGEILIHEDESMTAI